MNYRNIENYRKGMFKSFSPVLRVLAFDLQDEIEHGQVKILSCLFLKDHFTSLLNLKPFIVLR